MSRTPSSPTAVRLAGLGTFLVGESELAGIAVARAEMRSFAEWHRSSGSHDLRARMFRGRSFFLPPTVVHSVPPTREGGLSIHTYGVRQENQFYLLALRPNSLAIGGGRARRGPRWPFSYRGNGAPGALVPKSIVLRNGHVEGGRLNGPKPNPSFTCVDRKKRTVPHERVSREKKRGAGDIDRAGKTNDDVLAERKHWADQRRTKRSRANRPPFVRTSTIPQPRSLSRICSSPSRRGARGAF